MERELKLKPEPIFLEQDNITVQSILEKLSNKYKDSLTPPVNQNRYYKIWYLTIEDTTHKIIESHKTKLGVEKYYVHPELITPW